MPMIKPQQIEGGVAAKKKLAAIQISDGIEFILAVENGIPKAAIKMPNGEKYELTATKTSD